MMPLGRFAEHRHAVRDDEPASRDPLVWPKTAVPG